LAVLFVAYLIRFATIGCKKRRWLFGARSAYTTPASSIVVSACRMATCRRQNAVMMPATYRHLSTFKPVWDYWMLLVGSFRVFSIQREGYTASTLTCLTLTDKARRFSVVRRSCIRRIDLSRHVSEDGGNAFCPLRSPGNLLSFFRHILEHSQL